MLSTAEIVVSIVMGSVAVLSFIAMIHEAVVLIKGITE